MRTRLLGIPFIGLVLATTGCLSSSHRIPKGELMRLSASDPQTRGEKVRVVQNLGHQEAPPPAQDGPVTTTTVVYVHAPIWVDGSPRRHRRVSQSSSTGPAGGSSTGGPAKSSGGKSSGGKSGGGYGNLAEGKKDSAKALLIIAGVAAVALAATEGARYDGWVNLHPMHPVHLYGAYGGYTVLPLAHIDQQTAQWATRAYVREQEGPFRRLGRAPLNRQGWNYSVFLGAGEVPVINYDAAPGFNGHIQFGYFPVHEFGILLDFGFAWTEDETANTIYNGRTSLELQGMPLQAGPIHAGLFGQLGVANRFDDGIGVDDSSGLLGAGALLQLDLTTRLALTGRVGSTRSFGEWANEIGLGLSIY